jgi:hypothetical protein
MGRKLDFGPLTPQHGGNNPTVTDSRSPSDRSRSFKVTQPQMNKLVLQTLMVSFYVTMRNEVAGR